MSLETPIKIRMLQRKLYQKAKEEPSYRFYLLYDKMYRGDVLAHAYALVRSNQGAPGVDGQSFWGIESKGLEEWLSGIREDLRAKTYRPQAVRRVMIPKPGGGERPGSHSESERGRGLYFARCAYPVAPTASPAAHSACPQLHAIDG
jgi:RNA-directed DNA polymerase